VSGQRCIFIGYMGGGLGKSLECDKNDSHLCGRADWLVGR
jgi:hypothetical protein